MMKMLFYAVHTFQQIRSHREAFYRGAVGDE